MSDNRGTGLVNRLAKAQGSAIRRAREDRGWSQAFVAEKVGTTQQTVDRIEKGETGHSRYTSPLMDLLGLARVATPEEMRRTLDAVHEEMRNRTPEQIQGMRTLADQLRQMEPTLDRIRAEFGKTLLPVRQIIFVDEQVIRYEPVLFIKRPPVLADIVFGYGVIPYSDEMDPLIRRDDIVFVQPALPPVENSEVLLLKSDVEDAMPEDFVPALLCTLVSRGEDELVVRTWSPQREFTVKTADWPCIHTIVGKQRRGF